MLEPEHEILYPDDQWEEKAGEVMPQWPPRVIQPANFISLPATGIPQGALHSFMGNLHLQELQRNTVTNVNPIKTEDVANSVMDPVNKETITKYKTLIYASLFWNNWTKGVCKELGKLSQGYEEKGTDEYGKGTHIVLFMDLNKIKQFQETKW